MEKVKAVITLAVSTVVSALGALAIPVLLLVGCNVVDYATGLFATQYRNEKITSYKSIRGIAKKVCMWLLVLVGAWVDMLIQYSVESIGLNFGLTFAVSAIVAVWLVINEIISILENMCDIGVELPPFLLPIMRHLQTTADKAACIEEEKKENE